MQQAFQAALGHHESTQTAEDELTQARERYNQGWAAFIPNLSAGGSYLLRDPNSRLDNAWSAQLTATETLFRGGAEYAGLNELSSLRASAEVSTLSARQALFSSVAQAHYAALAAALDLENLRTLGELTQARVKELLERARVGRSRDTEAASARAQAAAVQAQIRAAQATLVQAQTAWARLTGLPGDQAPLKAGESDTIAGARIPQPFPPLEPFLKGAASRADVEAAQKAADAASSARSVAVAGHLPTIAASGNWYLDRSGALDNGRWDATLTVSVPLFSGGATSAHVREVGAAAHEAELRATGVQRDADQQVRTLYELVRSGIEQTDNLETSVKLSEEAYKGLAKDYRLGLATNLDVLQAMNALEDARRTLDRTRCQIMAAWYQLQSASGQTL
ncbi:MAG TPA: TolC family protein [Bdellovibrionota bacterium]|nr:TolC family protein [Bdellovibrionota bacterium]